MQYPKTVDLVTYSQADVVKVPYCEGFAEIVPKVFQPPKDNTSFVQKWVCGRKVYNQTRDFHYHLAIHLKNSRRWSNVHKRFANIYDITLGFRELD